MNKIKKLKRVDIKKKDGTVERHFPTTHELMTKINQNIDVIHSIKKKLDDLEDRLTEYLPLENDTR